MFSWLACQFIKGYKASHLTTRGNGMAVERNSEEMEKKALNATRLRLERTGEKEIDRT